MNAGFERFIKIREHYAREMPRRMAEFKRTGRMHFDPYRLHFTPNQSPIEEQMWASIRGCGLPFFPEFPVLNYFVDFGNPFLKIAIECDGKQWHDPEKDAARDARIIADGWTVYRAPGSECHRVMDAPWEKFDRPDEVDEEALGVYLLDWFLNTADGLLKAIEICHFGCEIPSAMYVACATATLEKHRSRPERTAGPGGIE